MNIFFDKNVYSNLVQQKFSIPANLISTKIFVEIKFAGIENLEDESILKSFYFFLLIFNLIPSIKNFNSRYHLGKNFYNFEIFLNFNVNHIDQFLLIFFINTLNDPHKINFNSSMSHKNLFMGLNDLKSFYLVESNPHFFKWEKELYVKYFTYNKKLSSIKNLNLNFFSLENLKSQKLSNFWSDYVS